MLIDEHGPPTRAQHDAAMNHAAYLANMMPRFLANKSSARVGATINWMASYCKTRLPRVMIDRDDPLVVRGSEIYAREHDQ